MEMSGLTGPRNALVTGAPVARASAPVARGEPEPRKPAAPKRALVELNRQAQTRSISDVLEALHAENMRSGSRIRLDESTDRIVVQILNSKDEVIRQFPPEEALRFAALFRQVTGLIFDQEI